MADQHALSLTALLQQVRSIVRTTSILADQQQQIMQAVSEMLQACARTTHAPLPGRDIQEIRGQNYAKRALEVAAAGGHNILLIGPQGAGKTLLARTFPSLLPENAVPYPFRAPHASIDEKAFIGTAKPVSPGELTLAHEGVLFLEHLSSFELPLLAALRQAVEEHIVVLVQRKKSIYFPARFVLVATVEPCLCGFYADPEGRCMCSIETIAQYLQRTQAVIDACFDIQIEVKYGSEDALSTFPEENSASIRQRVEIARELQQRRFMEAHFHINADLGPTDEIHRYCMMDKPGEKLLKTAQQQLHLSARQILRVQKVARTIADLAGSQFIAAHHIAESIQYQSPLKR
jgi:magnesium chelatase family protein